MHFPVIGPEGLSYILENSMVSAHAKLALVSSRWSPTTPPRTSLRVRVVRPDHRPAFVLVTDSFERVVLHVVLRRLRRLVPGSGGGL